MNITSYFFAATIPSCPLRFVPTISGWVFLRLCVGFTKRKRNVVICMRAVVLSDAGES